MYDILELNGWRMKILTYIIRKTVLYYPKSFFAALGLVWLIVEPIIGLTKIPIDLSYSQLTLCAIGLGVVWLVVDGFLISGFYRIKTNSIVVVLTQKSPSNTEIFLNKMGGKQYRLMTSLIVRLTRDIFPQIAYTEY